ALHEPRRYACYLRDLAKEKVDLSCWKDWNPVRDTARQVTSLRTIEAPDRITLTREFELRGARRLVQSFTLAAADPIVRIHVHLRLAANQRPQVLYVGIR